jgi:hypothetical protein
MDVPQPGEVGMGYYSNNNLPVPTPNRSPYDSDPGYQAALAQEQLGLSQNNAALKNLIQQRIISYGDPNLASMAGFGLDPQAAAFARQNYLSGNSQLARIDKQHKDNLQAIINQLAAHGILFSGDTGYRSGQEDQSYGNNVYDAQQAALADILGYRQSNLQQNQALHQSVIDALQNAYQTYLNHPELGGYGAPIATPAPKAPKTTAASTSAAQMAAALRRYNQNLNRNLYG